jgi:hypothetical protein
MGARKRNWNRVVVPDRQSGRTGSLANRFLGSLKVQTYRFIFANLFCQRFRFEDVISSAFFVVNAFRWNLEFRIRSGGLYKESVLFIYKNPNPDLDWHQNDAGPHAHPTPSFTLVGKSEFFLLVTPLPVYNLSCQCLRCYNFKYL